MNASNLDQTPDRTTAIALLLQQRRISKFAPNYPVRLRACKNCRLFVSPSLHPAHGGAFLQFNTLHRNFELGVVRRTRGEYGSYFCRRILHVDVFPVIPDVSFSPNVKASFPSDKDGPRAALNLFEANAA